MVRAFEKGHRLKGQPRQCSAEAAQLSLGYRVWKEEVPEQEGTRISSLHLLRSLLSCIRIPITL